MLEFCVLLPTVTPQGHDIFAKTSFEPLRRFLVSMQAISVEAEVGSVALC